eukprot:TRINITY_DN27280_c0_g1_i1.p1 TRINITY_DN27280_c0_g1~~TRINITY_DN27280_c0_g1_i1.p1  ORF type:complete len:643 (-),score=206.82 TRINITY_DN27280_c0_g1_i1:61-1989(-)
MCIRDSECIWDGLSRMPADYGRSASLSPESTISQWRDGGALPGSTTLESGAATVRSAIVGLDPCLAPLRLNCSFKRIPFMRWKSVAHYSKVVLGLDKSFRAECSTLHSEKQVLMGQVDELRRVLRAESPNDELEALVEDLQTRNMQQQLQLRQVMGEVDSVTRRFSARLQQSQDKQHELQGLVDAMKVLENQGLQTTVHELVTENRKLQKQLERSSERSQSRDGSQSREGNSLAPIVAQLELSKAMLQSQVDELKATLAKVEADWAEERTARAPAPAPPPEEEEEEDVTNSVQYLKAQLEEVGIKLQNSQLTAANACTEAEKYQLEMQLEAHKAMVAKKKQRDEFDRVALEVERLTGENSFLAGNELVTQHELTGLRKSNQTSKGSVALALGMLQGWGTVRHPRVALCVATWKSSVLHSLQRHRLLESTSTGVEIDRALLLRCKLLKLQAESLNADLDNQSVKCALTSWQLGALEHATQTELMAEYEAKEALGAELDEQVQEVSNLQLRINKLLAINDAGLVAQDLSLTELNDTKSKLAELEAGQPAEGRVEQDQYVKSLEKTVVELREQLKDTAQIHEEAQCAVQALEAQETQIRQLQLEQQHAKRQEKQLEQTRLELEENSQKLAQMEAIVEKELSLIHI